jgi:hypothetical protein
MNEVPKMLWNRWGAGGMEEWFLVIKAHGQSLLFNLNKKDGFLMTTDIFLIDNGS